VLAVPVAWLDEVDPHVQTGVSEKRGHECVQPCRTGTDDCDAPVSVRHQLP
jgi:hypothetical protein